MFELIVWSVVGVRVIWRYFWWRVVSHNMAKYFVPSLFEMCARQWPIKHMHILRKGGYGYMLYRHTPPHVWDRIATYYDLGKWGPTHWTCWSCGKATARFRHYEYAFVKTPRRCHFETCSDCCIVGGSLGFNGLYNRSCPACGRSLSHRMRD